MTCRSGWTEKNGGGKKVSRREIVGPGGQLQRIKERNPGRNFLHCSTPFLLLLLTYLPPSHPPIPPTPSRVRTGENGVWAYSNPPPSPLPPRYPAVELTQYSSRNPFSKFLVSRLGLVVRRSAGKRRDRTPVRFPLGITFLLKNLWVMDTDS